MKVSEKLLYSEIRFDTTHADYYHIPAPGCLGGEVSATAFCLCNVDGRSFRRNDVVLLNGDDS